MQNALPYECGPDSESVPPAPGEKAGRWLEVLLVEDDAARSTRRRSPGIPGDAESTICVRLHRIRQGSPEELGRLRYAPGKLQGQAGRSAVALSLLRQFGPFEPGAVVAAGTTYGNNKVLPAALRERGLDYVLELPPSAEAAPASGSAEWCAPGQPARLSDVLAFAHWESVEWVHPRTRQRLDHLAARFGEIVTAWGERGWLYVIQTGRVERLQRGTIFVLSSSGDPSCADVLEAISWTRWIRPWVRKLERAARGEMVHSLLESERPGAAAEFCVRVNIKLSRRQDEVHLNGSNGRRLRRDEGRLWADCRRINVAELFAGAGGMGLGFLMARAAEPRYRIVFSGEAHPVYVETLRWNHRHYAEIASSETAPVPRETVPLDLTEDESLEAAKKACSAAGGLHVLIGGPPCQGFSNANRNSWERKNPHNELVDVFLDYVEALEPRVFLMENVQGIVWTPSEQDALSSAAQSFLRRAGGLRAGALRYRVFPKVLDAVWYGVPQHRNRFFILGIREDCGYSEEDFGAWGPFPPATHWPGTRKPYVTVGEAFAGLPSIGNGHSQGISPHDAPRASVLRKNPFLALMRQGAPPRLIWDHVTSRHADYVIERFGRLNQGENWSNIREMFTNYADVERTHSNIYRRLDASKPSITIGHYRKSMLVHPHEDRGLSLREACRLQSFPDWFRFVGRAGATEDGDTGGLTHKQQQLANAVCPLVTKAIAEFIASL